MTTSDYIFDADSDNFHQLVIEASAKVPVLVDFWADWCGPCQSLMPVLAKLADEYAGKFRLVKVNSDTQQALAQQHGVRSLPTVKIFRHGDIVDEFMGALPESAVREYIDRHIERESDALRQQARQQLATGNVDAARELLKQAVKVDPHIADNRIELAAVLAAAGEFDAAEAELDAITTSEQNDAVSGLRKRIEYARIASRSPDVNTLQQRVAQNADDLDARLALAAHALADSDYAQALQQFLEIMQRDRRFADDAGHKGLLATFTILGNNDPLVQQYRRKMASLLY